MLKKIFSVILLLAFLATQSAAQTYTVSNTGGDSSAGDGSLGAAISASSSDGAIVSDTVGFNSSFSSPQTITLTSSYSGVVKNAGQSLTLDNPGALLTIDDGGYNVLNVSGGGVFTISNIFITGTSAAGVSVGAGTTLNTDTSIGTGLALSGGTLQTSASINVSGPVALTGSGGTFDTAGGQTTVITGPITGAGGLNATDAGTLVLANSNQNNSYTGGTTVSNGSTLSIGDNTQLGNTSGLTLNGGTLQTTQTTGNSSPLTSTLGIALAGAGGAVNVNSGQTTLLLGQITGSGGLAVSGEGMLTLSAANTYSGGTTIGGGSTLSVYADGNLGGSSGGLTFNGGTLQTTSVSGFISARSVALNGGGTIDTDGNAAALTGQISGAGGLTVESSEGSGVLTLSGPNSYTGGTTIGVGNGNGTTLAVSADANMGDASGGLTFNGGTLQTTSGFTSGRSVALSGNGAVDTDGNAAALTGQISGAGGLTVESSEGSGVLTLSGPNSYTGGTTIGVGNGNGTTLAVSADANMGDASGGLTFNGGTLQTTSGFTSGRSVALSGNGAVDTDGNAAALTGQISGAGGLTVESSEGSGVLTLSGPNSYTGGTTIGVGNGNGTTLAVSADANMGNASGGLTFNGGTLQTTSGFTSGRSVALSGNGTVDTDGQATALTGQISGVGGLTVASSNGGGVLTLNGANSYTGGTTIDNGATLAVSADVEMGGASGGLTFDGGALRTTYGFTSARSVALNGNGTIDTDGNATTLSGTISGSGGLSVASSNGSGVLTLSGANTYTGGTTIGVGATLSVSADGNMGDSSGGLTFNGGELETTSGIASARAVTLGAAGGTIDVASGQTSSLSGAISGAGSLTKAGAGLLSLSSLYSGNTVIAGGTLDFDLTTDQTYAGGISGAGALSTSGNTTLTLTGANSYAGGTVVNGGALAVSADDNLGDASGGLTLNGGTLVTTTGLASARGVTLSDGGTVDTQANDATLSGVIAGAGGLTKLGSGSLTLGGVNTYTGGTTVTGSLEIGADDNLGAASGGLTLNGATLVTTSGLSSARGVTLNGGGAVDTQANDTTLSGVIGGVGGLTKLGSGSLTLGGVNTYTGGTTVTGVLAISADANLGDASGGLTLNGGTLVTTAGLSSARSVALSGGGTVDADGQATELSGAISGAGGLTVASSNGGGVLTLSGANTYTGGTTIGGGATLAVSADGNMGDSSGGLTFNGGTLQTTSGIASARAVTLAAGGTIDIDGQNDAFSGVISGAGGLTVASSGGGGALTLSGPNAYTGGTVIDGGTLQLGANDALPSAQALDVGSGATFDLNGFSPTLGATTNGGAINAGAKTLNAASYSGNGTLAVTLQPSARSLNVAGTATLTGGTLLVTGRPVSGDYLVVTAGTLNGTSFASIVLPGGDVDKAIYGADSLTLELTTLSFTASGQTGNQSAVGAALNLASQSAAGGSDMANVTSQLNGLPPAQLNAALDQLSPISLVAMRGMGFAGSGESSAAVGQRLAGLQAGNAGPDGGHIAFFNAAGSESAYPGTLVAEEPGDTGSAWAGIDGKGCPWCLDDKSVPWGFFASAVGAVGQLDAVNGSAGSQPGYSFTSAGATVGVDYRVNDHVAAGISGGYVGGSAAVTDGSSVQSQSLRYGAYGTVYGDALHADFYLGGAQDFYDTSRNLSALGRAATASPDGQELNMDAQADYDLKAGEATVSPFAGLGYDRLTVGSFTEDGAGAMDLSVDPQTAESLRSRLGAKVSRRFKSGSDFLTPFASIGWQHEFENQSRAIDAQFASSPGTEFAVNTADVARDGALLGAGLEADWRNGISARLAYSGEVRSDFNASTFSGSVRLKF